MFGMPRDVSYTVFKKVFGGMPSSLLQGCVMASRGNSMIQISSQRYHFMENI